MERCDSDAMSMLGESGFWVDRVIENEAQNTFIINSFTEKHMKQTRIANDI